LAGQTVDLPTIRIPVSKYAPSGDYTLGLRISQLPFKDGATLRIGQVRVHGRENTVRPAKAEIRNHHGSPAVWINDTPVFAVAYSDVGAPSKKHAKQFGNAGVHLHELYSAGSLGWLGPGQFTHDSVDHSVLTLLDGDPDAYFFPRVSIRAPEWWLRAHPGELIKYADTSEDVNDVYGGTRWPSLASELWRKQAGEALREYVRHMQKSAYADRLIGYHIDGGIYGEWHYHGSEYLPDTSEPMTQAFRRWLRREYKDDVIALRDGWKNPDVTFENAHVPLTRQRFDTDFGIFRDPNKGRQVIDYYRCHHEVLTDAILHFAGIIKEESKARSLVGVFYGYTVNVLWPQEGGHWNLGALLNSSKIDFLCSPHSYIHRNLGEEASLRAVPGSLALHGKFFMLEADERTHLVDSANAFKFAKSARDSVAVMRRAFANSLTHNAGLWWFDMDSCWFDDSQLMDEVARMARVGRRSMELPRKRTSQIAVFASEDSIFHVTNWKSKRDKVTDLLLNEQLVELARVGAPYDLYEIKDLVRNDFPEYKLYVFLNCFYVSSAVRDAINCRVKRDGKTALWIYAPGLIDETGLGADRIRSLTGIELAPGQVETQPAYDPDREPELRTAPMPGWESVYSRGPVVSSTQLRVLARKAGCHIYSELDDPFYANSSYIAIHSRSAGPRTILLPGKFDAHDAMTGKTLATGANKLCVEMEQHETIIVELTQIQ
jgi:hypothetical protein